MIQLSLANQMAKSRGNRPVMWDRTISTLLRALLCVVLLTIVGCGGPRPYPSKTVTIICPWTAGGGTDTVSRFFAEALKAEMSNSFVVVNRKGGSGVVGHSSGAKAKPDGYTMTIITFELCTMHHLDLTKLTFADFECLIQVNADPAAIMVKSESPYEKLSDLLQAIKDKPGEVRMSGTAKGGAWDLARIGLQRAAGFDPEAVNWIPTDGSKPSITQLLAGEIDAVCCSLPEAKAQLDNGSMRALVVMSDERLSEFSSVPTAKELGIDWVAVGWRGLALPKGTPKEVVDKLYAACEKIAQSDEYKAFMKKLGYNITVRNTDEFTDFLKKQDEQWGQVIKSMKDDGK